MERTMADEPKEHPASEAQRVERDPQPPDGFDLARQWFEKWASDLHEHSWTPDVPHEGLHQLGVMINRALSEAYKAGVDSTRDLYRNIYGASEKSES